MEGMKNEKFTFEASPITQEISVNEIKISFFFVLPFLLMDGNFHLSIPLIEKFYFTIYLSGI